MRAMLVLSLFGRATFLIEIAVIEFLMMARQKRRRFFWLRLAVGLALGIVLFKFVLTMPMNIGIINMSYFIMILYATLLAFVCFDVSILMSIFFSFGSWATQHIAWNIFEIICHYVDGNSTALTLVGYFGIYAVVYGTLFFVSFFSFKANVTNKDLLPMVLISVAVLFFTSIFEDIYSEYTTGYQLFTVIYSTITCVLVLIIQFFILLRNDYIIKQFALESENSVLEGMLYQADKQQKLSAESIEIINRKCHDLKHDISVFKTLDKEQFDEYISEIERAIVFYENVTRTGNDAFDLVLTEKCLLFVEYKINFTYIVDSAHLSALKPTDISSLFGNMLNNAFESVRDETEEKRVIRLRVDEKKGFLHIHCENYCSRAIKFVGGLPTTESNKDYHGFGVKSMKFIAEKYHGKICFEQNDEIFVTDILIPLSVDLA